MTSKPWSDLTPTERRSLADGGGFATFKRRPASTSAHALLADLMDRYVLPAKMHGRKTKLGAVSYAKLEEALGAIVGELLVLAADGYAMKLSTRTEAFADRSIKETAFWNVMSPLVTEGLVERVRGYRDPASFGPAKAPLFVVRPAMKELADGHGVNGRLGAEHFPTRADH
jgi:hypothetical protein